MSASRFSRALAVFFALVILPSFSVLADERMRTAELTIAGIRPGSTAEELTRSWGTPSFTDVEKSLRYEVWRYPKREVRLMNHRVMSLSGESLSKDGSQILGPEDDYADVVRAFGEPERKINLPKGLALFYKSRGLGLELGSSGKVQRVSLEWTKRGGSLQAP